MSTLPGQNDLVKLHQIIASRFDEGELRTLCFNLQVDYDGLPGTSKPDKARELVAYFERRKAIPILVDIGKQLRPDIDWPESLGDSSSLSANELFKRGARAAIAGDFWEAKRYYEMVLDKDPFYPGVSKELAQVNKQLANELSGIEYRTAEKTPPPPRRAVPSVLYVGVLLTILFLGVAIGIPIAYNVLTGATPTTTATVLTTPIPAFTPTPTKTPPPTSTASPIPPSTSSPTPTPVIHSFADFENGGQPWLAVTPRPTLFGLNEMAMSATVSGEALQGYFNFAKTPVDWPRATFITYTDRFEDWTSFDELQFDAVALPPIQGNIKATINVRTGGDDCFNEYGNFLTVGQRLTTTLVFKLREAKYKTCKNPDDYRYPLHDPDQVIGLAIVVIPDPANPRFDARFDGAISIDNVRLVQTPKTAPQ
jgi:hypothetical protein